MTSHKFDNFYVKSPDGKFEIIAQSTHNGV